MLVTSAMKEKLETLEVNIHIETAVQLSSWDPTSFLFLVENFPS